MAFSSAILISIGGLIVFLALQITRDPILPDLGLTLPVSEYKNLQQKPTIRQAPDHANDLREAPAVPDATDEINLIAFPFGTTTIESIFTTPNANLHTIDIKTESGRPVFPRTGNPIRSGTGEVLGWVYENRNAFPLESYLPPKTPGRDRMVRSIIERPAERGSLKPDDRNNGLPPTDADAEARSVGKTSRWQGQNRRWRNVSGKVVQFLSSLGGLITPAAAADLLAKPKLYAFLVNWDAASEASFEANADAIDVVVPEWLHLSDRPGEIVVNRLPRLVETIDRALEFHPDLVVAPMINNFSDGRWERNFVSAAIVDPEIRERLVARLLNFVEEHDYNGITIDFEALDAATLLSFIDFISDLGKSFHENGLQVNVAVPLDSKEWPVDRLAVLADTLIVMGYDRHSDESLPGPIAPQDWFTGGFEKIFASVPASKVVVGIANYGYDWNLNDPGLVEIHSFQEAVYRADQAGRPIEFDPNSLNPSFSYQDIDGSSRQVWFLDAVTAFNQLKATLPFRPQGVALWRLGSEDPVIWKLFRTLDKLDPSTLELLRFDYQVAYLGSGEVLKLIGVMEDGVRALKVEPASGLITSVDFVRKPRPYEVARWGATNEEIVALTFDDGPHSEYTDRILDILKVYDATATFFILGRNAQKNPHIIKRIVAEGHELGNHTYTHPNIALLSNRHLRYELNATQRLIESLTGHSTLMFRPPYGEDIAPVTPERIKKLAVPSDLGYYTINMFVDALDWSAFINANPDRIAKRVIEGIRRQMGKIVLLHDGGGNRETTVQALPKIIETLSADGYRFVGVSQVIGKTRDEVMPLLEATNPLALKVQTVAFLTTRTLSFYFRMTLIAAIVLCMGRAIFVAALALGSRQRSFFFKRKNGPVGVVIPAYNEAKVICKTIESILRSTNVKLKILVVDDGSTDGTAEVVKNAFKKGPSVRVIRKANGGKAEALNLGFARLKTELIIALDGDTIFMPDTIEKMVRHFDDPKVAAVAGNAKVGNRVNLITKWQALEYITAQNLDRRAFQVLNCISVVPGAVGAWRRKTVLEVGGYRSDSLAEDADLTISIIRAGYRVVCEPEAIARTEAPASVRAFLKQRFRWMFGMLQVAFKHRFAVFDRGKHTIGWITLPNILIFQVFFLLAAPIVDFALVSSLAYSGWKWFNHPNLGLQVDALSILSLYLAFLAVECCSAIIAFSFEPKEQKRLLVWLLFQRFFYRPLMCYVAVKSILVAIRGSVVGWGKLERKATVEAA